MPRPRFGSLFYLLFGALILGTLVVIWKKSEPAPSSGQAVPLAPPQSPKVAAPTLNATPSADPAPSPLAQAPARPSLTPSKPATTSPGDFAATLGVEDANARELADIETLATTYSAEKVAPLARYLSHASPEVRAAAIDGLVRLGEASAAPLLREAAKTTENSDEIIAMLNAAKYLELPSLPPELIAKRKKKAAANPAVPASGEPGK